MKKWCPIRILTAVLILAAGCAGNPDQIKIPKDAAKMEITFSWEGIKACTHESPEIQVSNIPDGTKDLQVKLKNLNLPAWNHGGGIVTHDGSGLIPAGYLSVGYNGPCPPNQRNKYEFSVMALNAEGVIIGFGKAMQPFPPSK